MTHTLRTFYTILITQAVSQIGSQMTGLAIGIWLFQQTGDVTPLALVTFFRLVPHILLANLAGLAADRLDRRWLMALADTGAALGSFALMLLFFSGAFQVWHLYVITLLQEICRGFQYPAFTASVTMMVPDEQRDRANGIMQLTGPLAGIIAPGLTALVYSFVGVTGVLALDLLSFGVAITAMLLARIPAPPRAQSGGQPSLLRELTAGLVFFWNRKPFLVLLGFIALLNFVGVGLGTLQTPYLLSRTGGSEETLGVLLMVANIGAVAGGLLISAWGGTRPRIHTVMPALIVMGLVLAVFGMAQTPLALGAALFIFMALPMFANVPMVSMLQAKVPPDQQGRVFAAVTQAAMVITPLSPLVIGPLADNLFEPAAQATGWGFTPWLGSGPGAGIGLMIVIGGLAITLCSAAAYALPMVRHMEATIPDWQSAAAPETAEPAAAVPETTEATAVV